MRHGYTIQDVTPVIVTRGNVDMSWTDTYFDLRVSPVVWNNARSPIDLQVFGAFAAAACVKTPLIYMQDDDVEVSNWANLFYDLWAPGKIVCNMAPDFQRAYANRRTRIMGHGAVFETALVWETFERRWKWERSEGYNRRIRGSDFVAPLLCREAHRIFTGLNFDKTIMGYVGHTNKPWAEWPDRLWKQPDHAEWHHRAETEIEDQLEWEADQTHKSGNL